MGFLDKNREYTLSEILEHQDQIEKDINEIDKRTLEYARETGNEDLAEKIRNVQKIDFEAVARHDLRALSEKNGYEPEPTTEFLKRRDKKEHDKFLKL